MLLDRVFDFTKYPEKIQTLYARPAKAMTLYCLNLFTTEGAIIEPMAKARYIIDSP